VLSLGKGAEEDRQRDGDQRGGADGLPDAEGDEPADRGRQPAGQREAGEHDEAEQEDPLLTKTVGKAADREDEHQQAEVVGVEDPGDTSDTGAHVGHDRRDGDVDDGGVEQGHEQAERNGDQHEPLPW